MTVHDKTDGAPASDAPTTRTVFKMRPACGGQWLLCLHSIEVATMLDEADEGSTYEVEVIEMTDAQIENTGEFNGW